MTVCRRGVQNRIPSGELEAIYVFKHKEKERAEFTIKSAVAFGPEGQELPTGFEGNSHRIHSKPHAL